MPEQLFLIKENMQPVLETKSQIIFAEKA